MKHVEVQIQIWFYRRAETQKATARVRAVLKVFEDAKYWFGKTDTNAICKWLAIAADVTQIGRENELLKNYVRERSRMSVYTDASGEFPVLARMPEK